MWRMAEPIWTFLPGYFISTNDTPDMGLETMVFPAAKDAGRRYNMCGFTTYAYGVDWGKPYEEYTRHYGTVEQAVAGHKEIVRQVKERVKREEDRTLQM